VPAFAYRFDAADRSIVISGDTAPSQNLVKLAAGADVLVHSVIRRRSIDLSREAPRPQHFRGTVTVRRDLLEV
jgi:ribonuclease BN (tRNA processing enzyme)